LNQGKSGGLTQRVKPPDQLFYYFWGLAFDMLGRTDEAMGKYRKALVLNPQMTSLADRLRTYDAGGEDSAVKSNEPLTLAPYIHRADQVYREMLVGQHDPRYQQFAGREQGL
jgi:tetratricopeptide (TPR) repeat protein